MFEISNLNSPVLAPVFTLLTILQAIIIVALSSRLKVALKEIRELNRETFGMLRKIEGLTATKRDQIAKHYDKILEGLSKKLPTLVAAHTSDKIFETESNILKRLAELEPNFGKDDKQRKKLDELIHTMENLEQTIVGLTADTVYAAMQESRREILEGGMNDLN